jgi:hypothetical protein
VSAVIEKPKGERIADFARGFELAAVVDLGEEAPFSAEHAVEAYCEADIQRPDAA